MCCLSSLGELALQTIFKDASCVSLQVRPKVRATQRRVYLGIVQVEHAHMCVPDERFLEGSGNDNGGSLEGRSANPKFVPHSFIFNCI
jgi:hypothetical protein